MKLKYKIFHIILAGTVTCQSIDAAYLHQRAKDIYNYRFPSLVASAGLGAYAFANRYQSSKTTAALALLASAILFKHVCSVADTSTLEGLVAENTGLLSPYFREKIHETPQKTLYNLTNRLQQATTDQKLKEQINNLFDAVQTKFSEKDEDTKRNILDQFFNDPSTIQQKIKEHLQKKNQ